MSTLDPFFRFAGAYRSFGLRTALRVAYSKARGLLLPHYALPKAPIYGDRQCSVSILLDTALHRPTLCEALAEMLAERGNGDWEMCVCARYPVAPDAARTLHRLHGKAPWVRIILARDTAENASVIQWTVEQATGQAVLLLGKGHDAHSEALHVLADALHQHADCRTAVCLVRPADVSQPGQRQTLDDGLRLIVRKSVYLAMPHWMFSLDAAVVAVRLEALGNRPACCLTEGN